MTRALNKLSAKTAMAIKTPGRHSDGGGLYLSVSPTGGRKWVFLYRWRGKPTELGLGSARETPLAKAREKAAVLRAHLANGVDPRATREPARSITFGECSDDLIEAMSPSWRNKKHGDQWVMTLTKYAASIRSTPVEEITTEAVVSLLRPLWQRTPETAERLRGRIERVLDSAKARGLRSGENPARWRGHLEQLLPKRQRLSRGHHAALPYDAVPAFMRRLRKAESPAARALEFTVLTAARTGETLGALWSEFDLEKRIWTIPATRMKAGAEHRVPLDKRVIDLLQGLSRSEQSEFVFRGTTGNTLSNMAMPMLLRRLELPVTVHGFRSSFRDWASEQTTFAHETCEQALAHTISNKSEAAYRRGDQLEKRRALMEAWSSFCHSDPVERPAS